MKKNDIVLSLISPRKMHSLAFTFLFISSFSTLGFSKVHSNLKATWH